MADASSTSRRPLVAVLGALPLLAIVAGLMLYNRETRSHLAVIRACRSCASAGQPVESGWVEVQPGDAWSLALDSGAGMVIQGPARFEVAGAQRVALSAGVVYLASGATGRAVVLMPRSESAGIEGATVTTDGPNSRIALAARVEGNRIESIAGRAVAELARGPSTLEAGKSWQSGKVEPVPSPAADEAAWLDALTR